MKNEKETVNVEMAQCQCCHVSTPKAKTACVHCGKNRGQRTPVDVIQTQVAERESQPMDYMGAMSFTPSFQRTREVV